MNWEEFIQKNRKIPKNMRFSKEELSSRFNLGELQKVYDTSILSCLFANNNQDLIFGGGGAFPGVSGDIKILNLNDKTTIKTFHGHDHGIYQIALCHQYNWIASASHDYSVFIWNLEKEDVVFLFGEDNIIKSYVCFARNIPVLGISESKSFAENPSVYVYNIDKCEEIFRYTLEKKSVATDICLNDNALLLAFIQYDADYAGNERLIIIDLAKKKILYKKKLPEYCKPRIYSIGDTFLIVYFDEENEKNVIASYSTSKNLSEKFYFSGDEFQCKNISQNGNLLFIITKENVLKKITLDNGNEQIIQKLPKRRYRSIGISSDNSMVVAGTTQGEVIVIQLSS